MLALHRSDNRQIPLGPHDSWGKLGVHEHRKLVVEAVGKIDSGLELASRYDVREVRFDPGS